jgi:lipoprotein-anchoring transpeptidase ErfK/SrfK
MRRGAPLWLAKNGCGELGFARPMQPRSRMSDLWSLTPSSAAAPAQETKSSVQGSQSRNGDAELSVTAKYSIGFGHIMLFRLAKTIIAFTLSFCLALTATSLAARHKSTSIKRLDMASVNGTEWQENARSSPPLIIKLQVLLDRAHVSPGEIDGNLGENTRKAIEVFRELKGLGPKTLVDEQLWGVLTKADSDSVLVTYTISEKDAGGPFVKKIPADFRKKAAMERLGYTSAVELLAEKFHMSQQLLRRLNPGTSFDKAGQEVVVANVERASLPGKVSRIEVDSQQQRVMAYDKDHKVVAIYPATVGSEDRPSPEGEFKVTKITENPVYHYDPSLRLRGVHVQEKLNLPPGPNNPVGIVWIDLSAEGYGIHGTPDPDKISKTASHGCIRLTNWDALELAHSVSKGTPVIITRSGKIDKAEATSFPVGQLQAAAEPPVNTPPLPEQNPARAHRQTRQTPPGEVPTQPWTDAEIAAAKAKCTEALSTLKLDYEPLPPIKAGLCGTPAPILLKSLGSETKIAITPPATLDCAMAGALDRWLDKTVQPKAKELLGSPVIKLENISSYVCRNRYHSPNQPLSEHALANALDVSDSCLPQASTHHCAR